MTRLRVAAGDTFRSLRIRNFRLFFLGQLTSQAGTWVQMVAIIWVVLQRTDDGFALGLVSAAQFLPVLVFGAWGGVIADRVDHHRFMLGTQVAFTVISAAFAGLILTDRLNIWAIYVLSLAFGFVTASKQPRLDAHALKASPKAAGNHGVRTTTWTLVTVIRLPHRPEPRRPIRPTRVDARTLWLDAS